MGKTTARIEALEKRVAELERHLRGQAIELEPQFVDPLVEDESQAKGVIR